MDLIESLKKVLDEAVGVPQNLIPASQKVAKHIIDYLSNNYDDNTSLDNISNIDFTIPGPFQIADMTSKNVNIYMEFEEYSKFVVQRMTLQQKTQVGFPTVISHKQDDINVGIVLFYPHGGTIREMIDYLQKDKAKIISSIAHELKHGYDFYKKGEHHIEKYVEYSASQEVGEILNIDYLNDFLFSYYFFHQFENSVRPSEMLTYLLEVGATKETFLENFKTSNIFKEIKFSTELTYEKLLQELEDNYSELYNIILGLGIKSSKTRSDVVQNFLKVLRRLMINKRMSIMQGAMPRISISDLFLISMGGEPETHKFLKKFYSKLTSGGKFDEGSNYDLKISSEINKEFFEKQIESIKRAANNTYRKTAKVFSELPSEKDSEMNINKRISSKIK